MQKFEMKALIFSWCLLITSQMGAQNLTAKQILQKSFDNIGGRSWDTVKSLKLEGYGYSNLLEQSERYEGPYIPTVFDRTITKISVPAIGLIREKEQMYTYTLPRLRIVDKNNIAGVFNGRIYPVPQHDILQDQINYSPERILQILLASDQSFRKKDTIIHGTSHYVVTGIIEDIPVRIFIHGASFLPTAVEIKKLYSNNYLHIWGPVRKVSYYSFWELIGSGLRYPLQEDIMINGKHFSSSLINKWVVNFPVSKDSVSIPDSIRVTLNAMEKGIITGYEKSFTQTKQIAQGIWVIPGPCNATIVEQSDGLIIVDPSYSPEYGAALIRFTANRFPGRPIKALITTSDAWLHAGGINAFDNATLYFSARNRAFIKDLLSVRPEHHLKLQAVSDSAVVGTGNNKMFLYPFSTKTGERMMMIYFPKHHLLYTSDLYQPRQADGRYWNMQINDEVYRSVVDRNLAVNQFYGMHTEEIKEFNELRRDVIEFRK